MRRLVRDRRNKRAFAKARAEAEQAGGMVCATVLPNGRPVYFTMAKDAKPAAIEAKAFEVREGRGISQSELILRAQAEAYAQRRPSLS